MYECPNCGGNLKFDIPSQQLACAFCGTHLNPYEVKKEEDAKETEYFEVTVFTCPQCGGEILSTDNEAAAFCSFCGASTILSSRISKEKRPAYIIPFQKTKEDCKKAYARKMRRAFFVPGELKNPAFIDGFRGIYMPYWTYQLIQKGEIDLHGKKVYRKGDYIITDHYDLNGELEAFYLGYAYDASSSFYDNISEALAPYDAKALMNFTPAFLSGFYADTADVDKNVYLEDAMELANQSSFRQICKEKEFHGYQPDAQGRSLTAALHTKCKSADNTMYPVWFLSYRNGDRVGYATVNGQTGKVVADMPVDPLRYLIVSLILAVPIFMALNLFFTVRPTMLLKISMLLSLITSIVYMIELGGIRRKEALEGDKALIFKKELKKKKKDALTIEEWKAAEEKEKRRQKRAGTKTKKENKNQVSWIITVVLAATFGPSILGLMIAAVGSRFFLSAVSVLAAVGIIIAGRKKLAAASLEKKAAMGFYVSAVVVIIGAFISFFNPVSDLYYYGGAILVFLAVLFQFVDIILKYNRLAMRRLPQFDKKGGDDRA